MSIRWLTFAVWGAVAATAVGWAGSLFPLNEARRLPLPAPARGPVTVDLGRLLGTPVPASAVEVESPTEDMRFQLVGVISPHRAQRATEGVALIAIDGGLPRVFAVGAVVDGQQVLQAVDARSASLGPRDGTPRRVLRLAPREGEAVEPAPAGVGAGGPVRAEAPLTAQQLFQQRQQRQFEEEEMQNRPRPGS